MNLSTDAEHTHSIISDTQPFANQHYNLFTINYDDDVDKQKSSNLSIKSKVLLLC